MSAQTILLGTGYTLQRVAKRLPPGSTLSVRRAAASGYESVNIAQRDALRNILLHYKCSTLIDSVPPLKGENPLAGVQNIVDTVPDSSIKRVIYLSTTGVFGGEDGGWVNEETSPQPRDPKAFLRFQSEELYRSLASSGVEVCVVRIAGIYGPGRGLGISLEEGSFSLVGGGGRWSNRIHVEDLATILVHLIKDAGQLPPIIAASDGEPALMRDVVDFYCSKFGFDRPHVVPLDEAKERGLHTLTLNQRVSSEFVRSHYKFGFKYPNYRVGAGTEFGDEDPE